MKIFIAHASEDAVNSESLALGLRQQGHKVFFDAHSLVDAAGYTERIIAEIDQCDLFIFLISPEAVTEGRYSLTELKVAQTKWDIPDGRVLPVMLRATPFKDLPPYLRAVKVLEPPGDPVADVVFAVKTIGEGRRRKWPVPTFALACVALLAGLLYWWLQTPVTVVVALTPPELQMPSVLERGDSYLAKATFTNVGQVTKSIERVVIRLSDPKIMVDDSAWQGDFPVDVNPGVDMGPTSWLYLRFMDGAGHPIAGDLPAMDWQLCYWVAKVQTCTAMAPLVVSLGNVDRTYLTTPVITDLRRSATAVLARGTEFFLTTTAPNRIVRLEDDGQSEKQQSTSGEPVDIGLGQYFEGNDSEPIDALYVATKSPDAIEVFAMNGLRKLADIPIDLKNSKANLGLTTLSTQPQQVAVDADGAIWIVTGGGTGKAGLAFYKQGTWVIPSYFPDLADDARQLRLKSLDGAIWTVDTVKSPSSLRLLGYDDVTKFDGRDFDVVSCARDLVLGSDNGLILRDCRGDLVEIQTDQQKLFQSAVFGKIPRDLMAEFGGLQYWMAERLQHPVQPAIVGAYNAFETADGRTTSLWTKFVTSPENGEPTEVLNLPSAETVDMASTLTTAMMLLKDADNRRDMVVLRWKKGGFQ